MHSYKGFTIRKFKLSAGYLLFKYTKYTLLKIYKAHEVQVCHKPFNKLQILLVNPKDLISDKDKCGVIYKCTCNYLLHVHSCMIHELAVSE